MCESGETEKPKSLAEKSILLNGGEIGLDFPHGVDKFLDGNFVYRASILFCSAVDAVVMVLFRGLVFVPEDPLPTQLRNG